MHNFHFNAPRFLFDFAPILLLLGSSPAVYSGRHKKLQLSPTADATKNCNFLENLAQERPHSRGRDETSRTKSSTMLIYFSVAAGGQN